MNADDSFTLFWKRQLWKTRESYQPSTKTILSKIPGKTGRRTRMFVEIKRLIFTRCHTKLKVGWQKKCPSSSVRERVALLAPCSHQTSFIWTNKPSRRHTNFQLVRTTKQMRSVPNWSGISLPDETFYTTSCSNCSDTKVFRHLYGYFSKVFKSKWHLAGIVGTSLNRKKDRCFGNGWFFISRSFRTGSDSKLFRKNVTTTIWLKNIASKENSKFCQACCRKNRRSFLIAIFMRECNENSSQLPTNEPRDQNCSNHSAVFQTCRWEKNFRKHGKLRKRKHEQFRSQNYIINWKKNVRATPFDSAFVHSLNFLEISKF